MSNEADITTAHGRNDFVSTQEAQVNQEEQHAQSIIRSSHDVIVNSDDQATGEVLLNLALDTSLSAETREGAKHYEYYGYKNLQVEIYATSSFGVSSGALQVLHVTDPENATFHTTGDLSLNLAKGIRQQNSLVVRPRDTKVLKFDLEDMEMFTLSSASPRFSSFGNFVVMVRDPPAAGDQVSYCITLTGIVYFTRTTALNTAITFTPRRGTFSLASTDDGKFKIIHNDCYYNAQVIRFHDQISSFTNLDLTREYVFQDGACVLSPANCLTPLDLLKVVANTAYVVRYDAYCV